jgi:hypothetical protein
MDLNPNMYPLQHFWKVSLQFEMYSFIFRKNMKLKDKFSNLVKASARTNEQS